MPNKKKYGIIQKKVQDYAKDFGNKSANLMILDDICKESGKSIRNIDIKVPEIEPLSHTICEKHLDNYANGWRELWENFCQAQGNETKGLTKKAKKILTQIRSLIENAFENNNIDESNLKKFVNSKDMLMVRSTGMEDSADLANPGGNESIAAVQPATRDISIAIGKVIASYFSEKSLEQRIKAKDNITAPPFMPVLLQKMIGEPINGAKNDDEIVVSGVMYTGKYGTKIQLAPGHGELIVNSKAPFDSHYITRQGVVHSEIAIKPVRLVPTELKENNKIKHELKLLKNKKNISHNPAVPQAVVQEINRIGQEIEKAYAQPMDVEFVYNPKENSIYIVQARPIPKGDLKNVLPSSIKPEKIKFVKEQAKKVIKSSVIASAGDAAKIITSKDEILICEDIETALDIYLSKPESNIKAVVVKKIAPPTSHEAAEFNSKAIPVLKVNDLNEIVDILDNDKLCLLIDPQRKQLIDCQNFIRDEKNAEAELFDRQNGILDYGLFKSSISMEATISEMPWNKKSLEIIENIPIAEEKPKLKKLLEEIQYGDPDKANKAFNYLMHDYYNLIKLPLNEKKLNSYSQIFNELETIESTTSKNVSAAELSLNKIMNLFFRIYNNSNKLFYDYELKKQAKELLKQALITGIEISHILNEINEISSHQNKNFELYQRELLNLVNRLENIIENPGTKEIFSSSLYQMAKERKAYLNTKEKFAAKYPDNEILKDNFPFLVQFDKLSNYAINSDLQNRWEKFILSCSNNKFSSKLLSKTISFAIKSDLSSFFINKIFNESSKTTNDFKEILRKIYSEIDQSKQNIKKTNINYIKDQISKWEKNITKWGAPDNFESLYSEFYKDFEDIIKSLNEIGDLNKLGDLEKKFVINTIYNLTETIDSSIKKLKSSLEYTNKTQQTENFAKLLIIYHKLMRNQITQIPDAKIAELRSKDKDYNTKDSILLEIDNCFRQKLDNLTVNQLSTSGKFSVNSAVITSPASFKRQFTDRQSDLTLEDLFTLFHQNILASNIILGESLNIATEDMPIPVKNLIKITEENKLKLHGKSEIGAKIISNNYNPPNIEIDFNLPLSLHAGTFKVIYNNKTNKMLFKVNFFGEERNNRFKNMTEFAKTYFDIIGANMVRAPYYSTEKNEFKCEYEISCDNEKNILEGFNPINLLAQITIYGEVPLDSPVENIINNSNNKDNASEKAMDLIIHILNTPAMQINPKEKDINYLLDLCLNSNKINRTAIDKIITILKKNKNFQDKINQIINKKVKENEYETLDKLIRYKIPVLLNQRNENKYKEYCSENMNFFEEYINLKNTFSIKEASRVINRPETKQQHQQKKKQKHKTIINQYKNINSNILSQKRMLNISTKVKDSDFKFADFIKNTSEKISYFSTLHKKLSANGNLDHKKIKYEVKSHNYWKNITPKEYFLKKISTNKEKEKKCMEVANLYKDCKIEKDATEANIFHYKIKDETILTCKQEKYIEEKTNVENETVTFKCDPKNKSSLDIFIEEALSLAEKTGTKEFTIRNVNDKNKYKAMELYLLALKSGLMPKLDPSNPKVIMEDSNLSKKYVAMKNFVDKIFDDQANLKPKYNKINIINKELKKIDKSISVRPS